MGISQKDIDDYVGQIKKGRYDREDCVQLMKTRLYYLLPYTSLRMLGNKITEMSVLGVERVGITLEELTEFKECYLENVMQELIRNLETESKSEGIDWVMQYYIVVDKYVRLCMLVCIYQKGIGDTAYKALLKKEYEYFIHNTYKGAKKNNLTVSDTLKREFMRTGERYDI